MMQPSCHIPNVKEKYFDILQISVMFSVSIFIEIFYNIKEVLLYSLFAIFGGRMNIKFYQQLFSYVSLYNQNIVLL